MPILKNLIVSIVLLTCCCGANEKVLRSGNETPTPAQNASEPEKVPFERDLEDMRTAGFAFIFVLRRKDAGPMDAGDRAVIREQTAETNRRVLADDGRAVIIGTNFQVAETKMKVLSDLFAVEGDFAAAIDHTPPADNANVAGNANRRAVKKK